MISFIFISLSSIPENIHNPFAGDLCILHDFINSYACVNAASTLCLLVLSLILDALPISSTISYTIYDNAKSGRIYILTIDVDVPQYYYNFLIFNSNSNV